VEEAKETISALEAVVRSQILDPQKQMGRLVMIKDASTQPTSSNHYSPTQKENQNSLRPLSDPMNHKCLRVSKIDGIPPETAAQQDKKDLMDPLESNPRWVITCRNK